MDDAKELDVYDFKHANCDLTLLKYSSDEFRVRLRIFPGSVLGSPGGTFWTTRFSEQKIASDFLEQLKIEIGDISSGKIENKILAHFGVLRFDQPIKVRLVAANNHERD
jgi:hypothetical protein